MKIGLFPVPHIIIWNFEINDFDNGMVMENHYFLTRRGANRFLEKHSDELKQEGYSCGFGGEPLWFW